MIIFLSIGLAISSLRFNLQSYKLETGFVKIMKSIVAHLYLPLFESILLLYLCGNNLSQAK